MSEQEFSVGDRVRLAAVPAYFKTAEPMPMLRPPDVVKLGEEGIILDRRPGGYWGVRFAKGAFLVESQYLEAVSPTTATDSSQAKPSDLQDSHTRD